MRMGCQHIHHAQLLCDGRQSVTQLTGEEPRAPIQASRNRHPLSPRGRFSNVYSRTADLQGTGG